MKKIHPHPKFLNYTKTVFSFFSRIVSSNAFFATLVGLFALQALWIAWSGAFSMAYDEYYHLGIIQEYAKGWLPFVQQPPGPAELGAISRDPSFLYHYTMSFPWRIVTNVWHVFASQMIVMRIINIVMFVIGLYLYWRVLLKAGLSKRLTNGVMLFFTLIPTTVLLAAQLNYDNMMFLMSGLALLLSTNIIIELRDNNKIKLLQFALLVAVLLTGSIVKYAFLPLGVAIGLFVLFIIWRKWKPTNLSWQKIWCECSQTLRRPASIAIVVFFVIASILFVERIGVNVIRYHNPAPDCAKILPIDQCMAHDPYGRNVRYKQENFAQYLSTKDKIGFPVRWYNKMLRESFFAVGPREIWYVSGPPLTTGKFVGLVVSLMMIGVLLIRGVWLWRQNTINQLFIVVTLAYVGVLFLRNYFEYLSLGIPVAIHGRYLVYVLPLMGALTVFALRQMIAKTLRPVASLSVMILVGLLLLGGGSLPWVIRSADNWMWPHAVSATREVRSALWHFIPK